MIVGIDLGTTNTVVAEGDRGGATVFPLPQLVTPKEIEARPLLPSCLYAPASFESFADPWGEAPWTLGEVARRRGAEVPARLVASAKSWLCHPSVDREAAILPWGAAEQDDLPRVSPVDASARLLAHVRRVWDDAHAGQSLAAQEVVLTVPASFDEVARELTVRAAERAGLRVKLLEEPQAAFYDYMQRAGDAGLAELLAGKEDALVLVCDVGGGTTDLSLIQVARRESRGFVVSRVAVGHHLLLGGDNMDLALALACEERLGKLEGTRFGELVVACRGAKERLLAASPPDDVPVTVLGSGSKLVGGGATTRLSRAEVERVVLDGFFPATPKDARPQRAKSALVAFGLPYERDAAITRHVAWFLARHAPGGRAPDALLLNGGVFRAQAVVARLVSAVQAWGGPRLQILEHPDPDLGVARGAVAYGQALSGRGLRIGGGSARGYYVGVDAKTDGKRLAVCVVPRGAEEGVTHVARGRTLALVAGRPARFDLFASDDARVDSPGAVVAVDEESFAALPPVLAEFAAERSKRAPADIAVELQGELTAVGTVDLACVEIAPPEGRAARRFRLAFQIRGETDARPRPTTAPPPSIDRKLEEGRALIEAAFGKDGSERAVKDLLRDLERLFGERSAWTKDLARALFDALVRHKANRRKTADHERVFFLLAGFCVRPGFGDPLDGRRLGELAPLFAERLAFPDQARGWQQFWIAWRRAAGGLLEPTQTAIRDAVDPFLAPKEAGRKPSKKWKPQALPELLEMASSLERVAAPRRAELGGWILEQTWTDQDPRLFAALGRLGARVPTYASLHHVVAPSVVEGWLDQMLRSKWDAIPTAARAATELARVTGDRARDLGERVRREVEKRLLALGASPEWARAVREHVPREESERAAFFGEGLPVGLRLVDPP